MLKHRLISGTLMTIFFLTLVIADGWLDGSISLQKADDKPIQATALTLLILLLVIPANLELAKLAQLKNLKIFIPLTALLSFLFATNSYWLQIIKIDQHLCVSFLAAAALMAIMFTQYLFCGTKNVIANCGANYFSVIYLGILTAFCLAIRIHLGLWHFIMFVCTIKSADIGAYTAGTIFGKHKFSPKLSPGKTWEGMAGAVIAAIIVAVLFATISGIISWQWASLFGLAFAFIGQFGDLAESMLKRDAEQKDSAKKIPGFGGLLDVIDSPLIAAPFAYLFFLYALAK